ncbi:biotin--[acetyl-CoA-carboxylase] ligase [Roseomonas sp. OT10]|uniref:biotin--[acetyl-CoA-carboxylase] ligase n=1 Tax=Roseomonas cutis TaxID=2897332 RepID=UPI001E5072D4|nr:biotin--[acetyl-CoA-carboxylase] ligase [Roseomonas sp. OT10]UFN50075.1 biotin--[acetyl-CoA-carboxylase] ligase [Roseomonas sp. OT10]
MSLPAAGATQPRLPDDLSSPRPPPWRLEVHDSLPSTSTLLTARAEAGEPEGLAVLALRQTAGRGTQGRSWTAPAGNLSLSLLLRPQTPLREMPRWSLLAGVALAEALGSFLAAPARLRLKWPNDLLLDDRKCAGILVEAGPGAGGVPGWLVIGIGANLAAAPSLPDRPTASLAMAGIVPPSPEAAARAVLQRLDHWRGRLAREGFGPVRDAWLRFGPPIGTPLALRGTAGQPDRRGRFAGLAEDGALQLDTAGGVTLVASGELTG